MSYISNSDYSLELARGNVSGVTHINKFGRNPDVDSAAVEDLWTGGGVYSWPATAEKMNIVSTSTADDDGGTGANTIFIQGLDGDYAEQTETVTMDGQSNVLTANSYLRVYRAYIVSVGTGEKNAGAITGITTPTGDTLFNIVAEVGQTQLGLYTVPAGKTGFMLSWYASLDKIAAAGTIDIDLFMRQTGEGWRIQDHIGLTSTGVSAFQMTKNPPAKYLEKTDILISVESSANNADVHGGFDMILVDN